MANTLGDAYKTCRVSTGLDRLDFAKALLKRGFRAACAVGARGAQDPQKLAAALQQWEEHDACLFTDTELDHLLDACRQWLTAPHQAAPLAQLELWIAIRVARGTGLHPIIKTRGDDTPPDDS